MRKINSLTTKMTKTTQRDLILRNSKITTFLCSGITKFTLMRKELTNSVCSKNSGNQLNSWRIMCTRCMHNCMIERLANASKWGTMKIWDAHWDSKRKSVINHMLLSETISFRKAAALIWSNINQRIEPDTSPNVPTRKVRDVLRGLSTPKITSHAKRMSMLPPARLTGLLLPSKVGWNSNMVGHISSRWDSTCSCPNATYLRLMRDMEANSSTSRYWMERHPHWKKKKILMPIKKLKKQLGKQSRRQI